MASLPPGWEPDYDGSRWLYRYTPTGLTQFTFPKPGDEFPDFVAPGARPIPLAPEERLASEKQVKLRKQGIMDPEEAINELDGNGREDDDLSRMSATGYFDPSEFMYYEEGDDDGELTPIAGKEDNQLKFPLGFVAELPSSDTILCADELAPVELDAGSYQTTARSIQAEKMNDYSIATDLRFSDSQPTARKSLDEDDLYSSGSPIHKQPGLSIVSHPPIVVDILHDEIEPSAKPVNVRESESPKLPFPSISLAHPVSGLAADTQAPTDFSESHKAISGVPLVSTSFAYHRAQRSLTTGRSVDDIQAMPSSLQPHHPLSNRMRSKSATHEPWRHAIKFVHTGLIESQVSTPALSGTSAFEQHDKNLSSAGDERMSAWLMEQSLERPSLESHDSLNLGLIPSGKSHPEAFNAAQHPERNVKRSSPELYSSDLNPEAENPTTLPPPPPYTPKIQKHESAEQEDRVVESVIDVPAMSQETMSRGLQLVDVSSGLSRSSITRRRAVKKKRFSWESEADDLSDEKTEHSTTSEDPTPSTPIEPVQRRDFSMPPNNGDVSTREASKKRVTNGTEGALQSAAHAARHDGHVNLQPSPRISPLPSPRLPFGAPSPTHGQIKSSKAVLVKSTEERKASVATFEAGLHKPLPPLPLAPKGQPAPKTTSKQSTSNAFAQISELIAVTNATMPSARPLSALPPGPTAESVWRSLRAQSSRPDRHAGLTTPSSGEPATTTPDLPSRSLRHSRSISQLTVPRTGLSPPGGYHSRSQSWNPTSPVQPEPFSDSHSLFHTPSDEDTAWPKLQVIPPPTDGHKSHKRLSIHTTPAGTFSYHPLRSSPVFAPTEDAPETQEPQPVDYISEQSTSLLQPKPKSNRKPSSSNGERPRLQVKLPFVGLPSSPRPTPRPELSSQTEVDAKNGVSESNGSDIHENISVEETLLITQRRSSTESQVSSPTSSIFSTMRDSSVSATSSMPDIDSTSLFDLGGDMDKKQDQGVEQHHRARSESKERAKKQLPTKVANPSGETSFSTVSPTAPTIDEAPQIVARVSIQRPPNVPEAIRPAGTRASLFMEPKTANERPYQPAIPTLIVRAPTVKSRPSKEQEMLDEQPPVPQFTKPVIASQENDGLDTFERSDSQAQPVIEILQSSDNIQEETAPPAKSQGFMQSLRNSWQFTTSNAPSLSLLAGRGHARAKSQSLLAEWRGQMAEDVAMAKKQAVVPWQWNHRDTSPNRDSLPVNTESISNVGATIRFFNSSLQALRPTSEGFDQPMLEPSRTDLENDSRPKTVVVRRVGPPVVVRMPC